jgi:hypothetical protein
MLNLAGGTVQCLNPECIARGRAAAQRAAAAATAVSDARAADEELPSDGTRALKILYGCCAG